MSTEQKAAMAMWASIREQKVDELLTRVCKAGSYSSTIATHLIGGKRIVFRFQVWLKDESRTVELPLLCEQWEYAEANETLAEVEQYARDEARDELAREAVLERLTDNEKRLLGLK